MCKTFGSAATDTEPINMLFTALARAARFKASMILLAARNQNLFHRDVLNVRQLNANAVLVLLNGQDFYVDPATKFCPTGFCLGRKRVLEGYGRPKRVGYSLKTLMRRAPKHSRNAARRCGWKQTVR